MPGPSWRNRGGSCSVTWPDYEQLKNATFVIIVFSVLVGLIIWIMDFASRSVINLILGVFGA